MYVLHLRCEQVVFSHETALFFHDLTDREPMQYEVTVKNGYNTTNLKADSIVVYTVKKELHEVGRIIAMMPFGHEVPIYDLERTICDLIRNRNNTEIQTFQNALKQYAHAFLTYFFNCILVSGLEEVFLLLRRNMEKKLMNLEIILLS